MRILGIDTATSTASVALIENGTVVAQRISGPQNLNRKPASQLRKGNHAEIILPLVESLLREAQLDLRDISRFGISIGPGSFTGLRIGLSTIKGLVYGCSTPVAGISTLLANAARVTDHHGLICSILNARKNEVYAALFRKDGDLLRRITEDSVAPATAILKTVAALEGAGTCLFVGDGAIAYRNLIGRFFEVGVRLSAGESYPSVACAVARLSMDQSNSDCDGISAMGELVPKYLRAPECEMKVRSETQLIEMPSIMLR
jgi:tRNA threonylcarbamoyladenosine biosynthesis protein TsaB